MKNWTETVLGDVCSQVTVGHVGKTSSHYRDEGVIFLRTQNVTSDGLKLDTLRYVTQEFHDSLKKSQVQGGDVLLSRVVTDSVTCAVIPDGLGSVNCANVILTRPGPNLDSRFLVHYIRSPQAQKHLLDQRVGAAQKVVNTKVVKTWPIPLPPLAEQQRIVSILDEAFAAIDRAKEIAQQNLANARELFESYLNRVFTEKGEGWEEKTLGDVCDLQNGYAFKSKDYVEFSNTLNIRMSNIRPGGLFDPNHNQRFLPDHYAHNHKAYLLHEGDLIIAMTDMAGDPKILGVPTLVSELADKQMLMNQRVGRLFGFSTDVYVPFLRYFLTSPNVKRYYKRQGAGGLQLNISKKQVLTARFSYPVLSEQEAIAEQVSEIQKLTTDLALRCNANVAALDELKQSILQKAFTGQLTAKSPELEAVG